MLNGDFLLRARPQKRSDQIKFEMYISVDLLLAIASLS